MFERTDHHLAPWDLVVGRAEAPRPGARCSRRSSSASSRACAAGACRCRRRRARSTPTPGSELAPTASPGRLTATMRAAILHAYGPPENLVVEEVPDPQPKPHQLVVDVHACGVNFPDVLMVQDLYQFKPALPFAPGGEISGTVVGRRRRRHRLDRRRPGRRRHRHRRVRRAGRRRRGARRTASPRASTSRRRPGS